MKILIRAFWRALVRFSGKRGWVLSSHIAMSMMMALFPFVLFTVSLAGALAELSRQSFDLNAVMDLVFGAWPAAVSQPIQQEVLAVLENSGLRLVTFSGLVTLYFASNGVDAVRLAMVSAYHEEDARAYWKSRLICIGLVLLGGLSILAAAVFELLLPLVLTQLDVVALGVPQRWVEQWQNGLSGGLVIALPLIGVTLCHLVLPHRFHGLREIAPGVIVTFVLWWLGGIGFAIYVSGFAQYSATYAGLAGAMVALVFLYLNAAILILGAEFNGVLAEMRQARIKAP